MQLDPKERRNLRRQAARRRRRRSWITAGLVMVMLAVAGVGALAWARTRSDSAGAQTRTLTSPGVSQAASAPATLPAEKPSAPPTEAPAPVPVAVEPQDEASGVSDAVVKAAVPFPDAPPVKPVSFGQLKPKHKYVAITIDDGGGFQPEMLALLQKYDARCTTFVLGSWAANNKATLKKLDDAGFEIANHTWDHKMLTKLDASEQRTQLLRTQKAISAVTGNQAPYMRPPGGATNARVKSVAAELGYKQVMWNRSFGDSGRGATTKKLYENVVTSNGGIRPGDIILCHWGSEATYEAMKVILPELKSQGYEFVTISELIADSKDSTKSSKQ